MKENKPLRKTDYAYLVLKFENIVEKSDSQSQKPIQESVLESEPNQQQQQQQQQQSEAPINNGVNQGRNILNEVEINNVNSPLDISEADGEEGEYSITFINNPYTNILMPIETTSSFIEEEMNTDVPTLDDGEYGDDEVDETSSVPEEEGEEEVETPFPAYQNQNKEEDPDEETETAESDYYQNHKSPVKRSNNYNKNYNNKNNFLAKRNATVVEQRFSQFFVPINEYSVLKLKNGK